MWWHLSFLLWTFEKEFWTDPHTSWIRQESDDLFITLCSEIVMAVTIVCVEGNLCYFIFHEKGSRCVICGFHSNPGEEINVWFCIFSFGGTSSDGSTSPRRRTSSLCFHSTFPTNGTKSSLNYKYRVIIINTCTHCFVCVYISLQRCGCWS